MVVLDTSFIIDYLYDQEEAVSYFSSLIERNEQISTTVINIYELQLGLRKSRKREKNQHIINELRKNVKIYGIDLAVIDISTRISDHLDEKGEKVGDFDILIAAICLSNGERLLTRNVRHFSRMKGLEVVRY